MAVRVGVNGFGRMGRLGLRAAWGDEALEFVHINEIKGDAACQAHLLEFDSVHGRWCHEISSKEDTLVIDGKEIGYSSFATPREVDWGSKGVDLLVECSGKFKTEAALQPYFDQGIRKVLVSAPVPEPALNIVMGVNDQLYDPASHKIVTAASCTTNCLAPVVKVMHEGLGIVHGCMTTIHDITNTQTIVDIGHKDFRRARACGSSLIPTTTGSARAITRIFPELTGKLNGLAVRVPLLNASLTDFIFESRRETTVEEVNALFKGAAEGTLAGILGYEERPLVSIDYKDDPRSSIVDALSTMVIDGTQVKVLAWYDNEWGYVNRMMELAGKIGRSL
ncbi:MAG: ArsJ-associated glyceraldehyde-3-phosphate dehydrogenase [Pseudomonadota bacterium]|nr:ArsJ-associated glyceraldehyde-3-phosphate dehydrogenase [Pseudomonadota bacterium]